MIILPFIILQITTHAKLLFRKGLPDKTFKKTTKSMDSNTNEREWDFNRQGCQEGENRLLCSRSVATEH